MRQFDFYEFVGVIVPGAVFLTGVAGSFGMYHGAVDIIVPGAVFLTGVALESPWDPWEKFWLERIGDPSIGGLVLGVILAYAAGHLVQAVGNMVEKAWWWAWGGMPSDWPRSGSHTLIAPHQVSQLEERVRTLLHQPDFKLSSTGRRDWYSIVRQVYAAVAGDSRSSRVDVFNGNYGLCRGLAASFLALIPSVALIDWPGWGVVAGLGLAAGIALYRMHRFGVHYGREVFVQLGRQE